MAVEGESGPDPAVCIAISPIYRIVFVPLARATEIGGMSPLGRYCWKSPFSLKVGKFPGRTGATAIFG